MSKSIEKESKSKQSQITTPLSGSSNLTSTTTTNSSGNAFKAFEKSTIDDWDIDNEDDGSMLPNTNLNQFYFPISIKDSEEMAKHIIRSHQEKKTSPMTKKPSLDEPTRISLSPGVTNKSSSGPGKALRQDSLKSIDSQLASINYALQSSAIAEENRNELCCSASSDSNVQTFLNNSGMKTVTANLVNQTASRVKIESQLSSNNGNSNNKLNSGGKNPSPVYIYNKNEDMAAKCEKFKQILETDPINIEELHKASWKGIPKAYRSTCWKILSDYLPLKHELQEKTVEQKRNIYWESVSEYYSNSYLDSHHDILRQILNDIPRMNPLISIFQQKIVQDIFQRVLYVWAIRHPATAYVQGINDLLTPFFVVFLTDYTEPNIEIQNIDFAKIPTESLRQLEADSYWCMNKLLERIQENYVFLQPGIQKKIQSLEDLIKRIDNKLYLHLKKNNIDFIQFAFRWMNNLLMREIPLYCTIRLWDTYHAEHFGFSDFHLYVCAAFLLRYSKNLIEEKDFQGLMLFLQNLPTRNLKENDIDLITAEAYKLQVMFANSPNHTLN